MNRILSILLGLLSMALPMSAAVDGKFQYSYPEIKDLPYDLGYQYSRYDLDIAPNTGYEQMILKQPVTLTYHILSEAEKTVEVVFDPSYLEMQDVVIPEKVTDPDTGTVYTVTTIGKMAFDDCPAIRSVIMANSITRIEDYAFNMCENKVLHHIGYIKFSENLTHIGNFAFKNCHNLTTGYFKEGNQLEIKKLDFLDNPDIPVYGFGGRLTGTDDYLLLPASVEYIGKHAFEGCYYESEVDEKKYGLCKVKIPNPSCVIDDYAFAGCEFLELVTIGEELNYDGLKDPNPVAAKKGRIGAYAFANCNLMRLDIPSSIESIGDNAFINCFKREMMKTEKSQAGRVYYKDLFWFYPRSLFNNEDGLWHKWRLWGASGTESGSMPADISDFDALLNQWHTNTVTIHSNQTAIGNNAFANNPQLKQVIITGPAGEFGSGAFRNCTNLSYVDIPSDLKKIGSGTFVNCSALSEIIIPEDVTEIGDSAFYQCEKLVTVTLPAGLKKVNPYTFYGCRLLKLTELPDQVGSIGKYAFYGCESISSITIPDKVTTIGDYAFAGCYKHAMSRDREFLTGLTKVKIGNRVTKIGAHAFDGCRHLGQIDFGSSVATIGDYAFLNIMSCPEEDCNVPCDAVNLPNSVTSIGVGVFQGASLLPGISLSESVTNIPDYAFAYCSNLASFSMSPAVESISKSAFIGCYSLQNLAEILNEEGLEGGIYYEGTEVVSALPSIVTANIKEGVTKIRDGAFEECGALSKIVFPKSLQYIGSRAFKNCVALPSAELLNIEMGDSVYAGCIGIESVLIHADFDKGLTDNWFAGCFNMSSIEVEEGNKLYKSDSGMLLDSEGTTLLRAPSGIGIDVDGYITLDGDITIPETVTTIGDYSFSNCIRLYSVEIPPTVTHIGAHAFDGCFDESEQYGLAEVAFYNLAVTIGDYAFNNCKNLGYVGWDGEGDDSGNLGSIGAYAFNGCENLDLSNTYSFSFSSAAVDTLKPYAFANTPGLIRESPYDTDVYPMVELELPATLKTIGDHAFENCSNLGSVVFPDSLKSIGRSAFKSSGLTSLDLPDSIEEIGDSAFMDSRKVMALKLPSGITEIKPYTFYGCFSEGLFNDTPEGDFNLSVEIPDGVKSIGDYAFYGCAVNTRRHHGFDPKHTYINYYYYYNYGLASLTIGKDVRSIGAHAFDGCSHLVRVDMGSAVTSIGDYAFNNCFNDTFLGVRNVEVTTTEYFVNKESLAAYPVVWEVKDYAPEPVTLPESLNSLGEYAFSGCAVLPAINFPGSLEEIPYMAFNGCSNLPEIKLSEGLKSIGDYAFAGSKRVKEISIPASLEKGSRVFVDCDSALNVSYLASKPRAFDEGFFSPKVYASKEAVLRAPNALLENLKGINPWALFYRIVAQDDTLEHLERVLEVKNGLRFRVLSNKPNPYCEVAGPAVEATGPTTYDVPEYVENTDPASAYFGKQYKVIRIGNDAFENDLNLVGINIPDNVYDIGQEAFNGCKNLPEITLPNSITNIGERAFANCYGLTSFVVPPKVTRLNVGVLKDCRGLYSVTMHDDIEELCAEALMDCRHLRAFERSENWNLKLIDDYALKNCIELEVINIPEGVQKIGKEAMYYCQKLKTVSLPKSLLELGENTFDDCEVLTTIKVYTETPPKTRGERNLTDQNCKIYVQAKCLDAYKEFWKVHEHRIEPGIQMTMPVTREDMPEYLPGNTYFFPSVRPLDGQKMTWIADNKAVATAHGSHDGTFTLNAVGRTDIHVKTDQHYYHDCVLKVYPQLADANWNGRLDIGDAVNIANYVVLNQDILDNWWLTNRKDFSDQAEWSEFYYAGADVNGDNHISVSDASAAVKMILSSPAAAKSAAPLAATAAGEAPGALILGASDAGILPVGLESSHEFVALQADIRVPEGSTLEDVKAGSLAQGHELSSSRIDERTMRVVLFDLGCSAFAAADGALLELNVGGASVSPADVEITGIIAADISSRTYDLTSKIGNVVTGITGVEADSDISIRPTAEGVVVGNAEGKTVNVYTIDGRIARSHTAASGSDLIDLPAGIYVVSVGKKSVKVIVK